MAANFDSEDDESADAVKSSYKQGQTVGKIPKVSKVVKRKATEAARCPCDVHPSESSIFTMDGLFLTTDTQTRYLPLALYAFVVAGQHRLLLVANWLTLTLLCQACSMRVRTIR